MISFTNMPKGASRFSGATLAALLIAARLLEPTAKASTPFKREGTEDDGEPDIKSDPLSAFLAGLLKDVPLCDDPDCEACMKARAQQAKESAAPAAAAGHEGGAVAAIDSASRALIGEILTAAPDSAPIPANYATAIELVHTAVRLVTGRD